MSDEELGAAPEAAQTEEPQESQQESQSVPEPEEMSEEAKKAYEGKSPEELAQMHHGLSKKLGEQGQVIGSLKDLVEELRVGREQRAELPNPFQPAYQPAPEVAPQVSQEEQLADDDYLTVGIMKQVMQSKEQQQQQQQFQGLIQKTSAAFDKGRASMAGNTKLYDGIENEVAQRVAQSYQVPFRVFGMDVSDELQNPDRWKEAAIYIRAQRGEYDRIADAKPSSMTAPVTETPSSASTSGRMSAPVEVDFNSRDMQEFMDTMERETGKRPSKKEVGEIVRKGGESLVKDASFDEIQRRFG